MNTISIDAKKLQAPACPHCGAAMQKSGDLWENNSCPCWWAGAADGIYPRQVRIELSDEEIRVGALDAAAAEDFIRARRETAVVANVGRLFDDALEYERANEIYLTADPEPAAEAVIRWLYGNDPAERWTIMNKRGRGMRKLIHRWLREMPRSGSLAEAVMVMKSARALQMSGRDPFPKS